MSDSEPLEQNETYEYDIPSEEHEDSDSSGTSETVKQFNEGEFIDELLAEDNTDNVESENNETEEQEPTEKSTKLPLARVKAIMKMDPDLSMASQESILLVARATEMFLKQLAQETYFYTSKAKRKTLQKRDVDAAIENIDAMCFLEGALD